MSNILVVLESRDGSLRSASLEAVGAARLIAEVSGASVLALATETCELDAGVLGAAGADLVLMAKTSEHSAEGAAATVARVAKEHQASVVLLAATVRGRDLTGRIAALLETGFAADCTALDAAAMTFTRPILGGKAFTTVKINGPVAVASLRANFFAAAGREANAEVQEVVAEAGLSRVTAINAQSGGRPDVSEATRVISGGRGMGDAANWNLLEAVADAIPGCALGASRAVVDSGWRPHSEQVGQTGKTVAPELYIAAGISGAIQHLAGMNCSKVIVAINKDADAPIFKHATYGIVGDALEVLPALAAELQKLNL